MRVLADTSFLLSLYVEDSHSPAARQIMIKLGQPVALTLFNDFEFTQALRLALHRKLVNASEVAMAEARAALSAFQRLPAARDADDAAALLRSLGVRPTLVREGQGQLTARETDVLHLLGHGLTNPEIADRLFISRKTVEHHVANVLSKLGLRSRAEAAGYVARTEHAAK